MEEEPEDEDQMWKILSQAMEEAAKQFVESRKQEGERLKEDLLGKLDYMAELAVSYTHLDVYKRQGI